MKRHAVVFALFFLLMLTYIDRVCLSVGQNAIVTELDLSATAMGLVFSTFAFGYASGQIPSGWFADKAGPRAALALVVAVWSVLIALAGTSWNLASLTTFVFLFGVSEAGAYPGSLRAVCNWLPPKERGRANAVMFSGSRLGAALAFPLLTWMEKRWQWRTSFQILGIAGLAWALLWFLWFRNDPPEPLPVETMVPRTFVRFRDVLRSKLMALAMAQFFAVNFTFFICITWMLPYFKSQYHLNASRGAAYAMVPLLSCVPSQWLSGWMVDRIYRSALRSWSRRFPGMLGFSLAAVGILMAIQASTPRTAVVCFTMAAFGVDLTSSPGFVFCADIAGENVGGVSAAMNMVGNLGAFVTASAFPYLHAATGSATTYFVLAGLLNLGGVFCWFKMRSLDPDRA